MIQIQKNIKKIFIMFVPLIALLFTNYFISKRGELLTSNFIFKSILIIGAYLVVYYVITTKNKLFNLESIHKKRYIIAIIVFAFLVIFKFHGSSISTWDNYYRDYGTNYTKTVVLGLPRPVRSDEWLVQTPLYLSQVVGEGTLSRVNENIRSDGQDVIVSAYAPALDICTIGKPFNWGFLFLGPERGFSWYWNSKLILLALLSYEIILILTKRNRNIALIGMFLITFSSATQWWFSSIADLVVFAQGLVVSVYYYLKSNRIRYKVLNVLAFICFGAGFVISLYPPIQVSLGYAVLIFLIYVVLSQKEKIRKRDYFVFAASTLAILSIVAYFLFTAKDALSVLMGTVYPGARVELGGEFSLAELGSYLVGWFLPYKDMTYLNASEVSGYISLIPMVIILFFLRDKKDKNNLLIKCTFIYFIIMCIFVLIGFPEFLAKITLFSYVPVFRMRVTIGLVGTYLICMLLSNLIEKKNSAKKSIIITIITMIVLIVPMINTAYYEYLGKLGTVVTAILFGLLVYYFTRGYIKEITPFVVVFMLITGIIVNPICRGLAPIYNKEISKAITSINEEDPGKWVALDSLVGGEFLNANGVKVFNSAHHYPDLKMWRSLDVNDQYEDIYNRFAHIIVNIVNDETNFEFVQDDVIIVNININDLDKTGIEYILSNESLEQFNKDKVKFEQIYYNEIDNAYIYKYVG